MRCSDKGKKNAATPRRFHEPTIPRFRQEFGRVSEREREIKMGNNKDTKRGR